MYILWYQFILPAFKFDSKIVWFPVRVETF